MDMNSPERILVSMDEYNDFPAFLRAHMGEVFRYWVYRRGFTPYEQRECFMDESIFEDTHASVGIIRECISLGDRDFLIGFQPVDDCGVEGVNVFDFIEYYKLSEIRLNRTVENKEEE